ncbi:MAG: DUF2182 domain-containing protein [Gammaproteobacteria bacterium]|nr:MAG: DUF2182 domain-containing protein [Gammaproteobacteria bacterium]
MTGSTIIVEQRHKSNDKFFVTVYASLFAVCAAATIVGCMKMSAMGEMSMAGGWNMSMMWMLMPGQTWISEQLEFAVMWLVMMAAMMMPALLPVLMSYRRSIGKISNSQLDLLAFAIGVGYFSISLLIGIAVFPIGFLLASLAMQHAVLASTVPVITGVVIAVAGALQFTQWKFHRLSCCRNTKNFNIFSLGKITCAWRYGLHLGINCNLCCAGLTLVLLLVGVMNPLVMLLVAIAVTIERVVPKAEAATKIIGVVLMGIGIYLLLKAIN